MRPGAPWEPTYRPRAVTRVGRLEWRQPASSHRWPALKVPLAYVNVQPSSIAAAALLFARSMIGVRAAGETRFAAGRGLAGPGMGALTTLALPTFGRPTGIANAGDAIIRRASIRRLLPRDKSSRVMTCDEKTPVNGVALCDTGKLLGTRPG